MNTPSSAVAAWPLSELPSRNTTMPTRPHRATVTTTISSRTGRRSSRRALRRVAAASIGHSTIQPTTTKKVWVAAIPARMASGVSLDNATAAPTAATTGNESARRGTAESDKRMLTLTSHHGSASWLLGTARAGPGRERDQGVTVSRPRPGVRDVPASWSCHELLRDRNSFLEKPQTFDVPFSVEDDAE